MAADETPGRRVGVLCAGSVIVDVGKVIDRYPEREHLATIERVSSSTGGPGLNMAVDLRMLGASWPVAVAGAVGDDTNGAYVLAECAGHEIDTAAVRTVTGAVTSFTDAMVEVHGGRRTYFHHAGANAMFDGANVDVESSAARVLHLGAPGIHVLMDRRTDDGGNGWSALLERAHAAGMRTNLELVSIDAPRLTELVVPCLPHLDTIVVNELEAAAVTGIAVTPAPVGERADWERIEATARELVGLGVSGLAVVHFPAGCVAAAPGDRTWRHGSVRVPDDEVISATGAGDAFAAGVLFGHYEDRAVEDCLELGVAAAATSLRSAHTSAGIRSVDECLELARRNGYRPTG